MSGYLLLHYQDGAWHNGTVPFETEEKAQREIQAMKDVMPSGYFDDVKFAIIPNDGEAQAKYRPLDCGDMILYD